MFTYLVFFPRLLCCLFFIFDNDVVGGDPNHPFERLGPKNFYRVKTECS